MKKKEENRNDITTNSNLSSKNFNIENDSIEELEKEIISSIPE